jgi:hypothetical protein
MPKLFLYFLILLESVSLGTKKMSTSLKSYLITITTPNDCRFVRLVYRTKFYYGVLKKLI